MRDLAELVRSWIRTKCTIAGSACLLGVLTCLAPIAGAAPRPLQLDEVMPVDKNVTVGTLANGLKYYIRVNHRPEHRALLRLVVNVGSVVENDDEQGLAHFTEHMAFNGTKNFPKQALTNYLESIGMRFGPEINGYTGFDQTVFMLEVPTDSAGVIEQGMQILADWACNISFDDTEIDKERGVVIEEWRLGQGASMRMMYRELPVLLRGSRYADRIPIGRKEILESFKPETLRDFYRRWYRPDLMAIVAVGDFDPARIEALIGDRFAAISRPPGAEPRPSFPVPDNVEPLAVVVTDKEATQSSVSLYHKLDVESRRTVADYEKTLIGDLYNDMLNARLVELAQQAEPPFVYAFSDKGRFIETKEFYTLGAAVKDDALASGLRAVLVEGEKAKRFGFTRTEMDRQKDQMLRNFEKAYSERDKTESSTWADKYIASFIYGEPIPGIEYTFEMAKQLIPRITLENLNALAVAWMSDKSNVVVAEAPRKQGLTVPSERDLLAIVAEVRAQDVTPYEDKVSEAALVGRPPVPSAVATVTQADDLGIIEWNLANGVRVMLKPTDFKNDEIQFLGFAPGGTSLAADDAYVPAWLAPVLVSQSGVGKFDFVELRKRLTGKVVTVNPEMDEISESLRGSASPQDVETMFQLIYLYFTAARLDSVAYLSYRSKMEPWLRNRGADPGAAFADTISVTLSRHSPRRPLLTTGLLDKMNLKASYDFYRARFADASDFTFVIVGAFEPAKIKPLVETYLGGLPSIRRHETWRDVTIKRPTGVIKKVVRKGVNPKSQVNLTFTGSFDWSLQASYELTAMADLLRIKLREILREDEGGTYDVSIGVSTRKFPQQEYSVGISFGCDPKRVDELAGMVLAEIDSLAASPPPDSYVTKVKEAQRREWEVSLKQNGYWVATLRLFDFYGLPRSDIMKYGEQVDALDAAAIRRAAGRYLRKDNFVEVELLPEQ
jgi:zinc protease